MKDSILGIFGLLIIMLLLAFGFMYVNNNKAIEKLETIITNDSVIVYKLDTLIYKINKTDTIQN